MHENILERGNSVIYLNSDKKFVDAIVKIVHFDDSVPYYTIEILKSKKELQTERKRLYTIDDIIEIEQIYNSLKELLESSSDY